MKNRIFSAVLCCAVLLSLAGCSDYTVTETPESKLAEAASQTVTIEKKLETKITEVTPFAAETQILEQTTVEKENTALLENPAASEQTAKAQNPVQTQKAKTELTVKQTEPPVAPKPPEPPASPQTQAPKPAETTPKPAETTPKPVETTVTPKFDVDYWVQFTKDYAQGIGLGLDETATGCWDTPTGANARSIYLERDLTDLLDWYKDSGFKLVWVWHEQTGSGEYLIYVGYS